MKETYGHDFVFITDYPHEIRAFYHMRDDETGLTKSYDLLYNGVEITTGAQREHRVDILIEQAKQKGLEPEHLDFYFDFFRYGVPPHGGFGMGLARVLMLHARRVVDPRGHLPVPRPDAPRAVARPRPWRRHPPSTGSFNFRDTGGTPLTQRRRDPHRACSTAPTH